MRKQPPPQGCVLSPFLFVLYINDMCCDNDNIKILKYADDSVIAGLISDNDESNYRNCISDIKLWCENHNLI